MRLQIVEKQMDIGKKHGRKVEAEVMEPENWYWKKILLKIK
jgi:hypothetical protein